MKLHRHLLSLCYCPHVFLLLFVSPKGKSLLENWALDSGFQLNVAFLAMFPRAGNVASVASILLSVN